MTRTIKPLPWQTLLENNRMQFQLLSILATAVPNTKEPIKFARAAIATACMGFRTLVPTTVPIELAKS